MCVMLAIQRQHDYTGSISLPTMCVAIDMLMSTAVDNDSLYHTVLSVIAAIPVWIAQSHRQYTDKQVAVYCYVGRCNIPYMLWWSCLEYNI